MSADRRGIAGLLSPRATRNEGRSVGCAQVRVKGKGTKPMETLIQDMKFGLRMLVKSPSLSIVATIALALGIGANTAIFSVVNAVLLRPLPFPNPDSLVALRYE